MPRRKTQKTEYCPGEVISCIQLNAQYQISMKDEIREYLGVDVGDWITAIQGMEEGVVIFQKYEGEYDNDSD